ncbi:hypothetical protein FFH21_025120 [Pseudomonas sp. KBS0707]|nr:hypothetical protein FFH21_025120 [Pseudomonas sp. KBS0707]
MGVVFGNALVKNFILVEAPLTSEAKHLLLHLDPDMPDELREFKPFKHAGHHAAGCSSPKPKRHPLCWLLGLNTKQVVSPTIL